jgi:hypothetical protein
LFADPDGCLTPRQTGRLTVGRNITSTFDFDFVKIMTLIAEAGTIREPKGKGASIVVSRYQATVREDFMLCCGYNDLWSLYE